MIRVDMIGANAVGKTTLLRQAQRSSSTLWQPVKSAQMRYAAELLARRSSALGRLLQLYPYAKGRHKLALSVIKRHSGNTVWDDPEQYADFIEAAIRLSSQSGHRSIQTLAGLHALHNALNTLGYLARWNSAQAILFDESLCQKVFGLINPSQIDVAALEHYIHTMPAPDLLVHCETDFDRHLAQFKSRVRQRGYRVRNSQYYLETDEALADDLSARRTLALQVATKMRERGVPVVSLDLSEPSERSLQHLNEAVQQASTALFPSQ